MLQFVLPGLIALFGAAVAFSVLGIVFWGRVAQKSLDQMTPDEHWKMERAWKAWTSPVRVHRR